MNRKEQGAMTNEPKRSAEITDNPAIVSVGYLFF